jgi:hypothetical protein
MGKASNVAAGGSQSMVDRYLVSGAVFLLLLSSVFQGVAIFSVTTRQGFTAGIAPYWLIVPLSVLAAIAYFRSRRRGVADMLPKAARTASICLLAFAAYGIASAFTLPFIFHGIKVLDPRLGMDSQYLNPSVLRWSLSNAGQALYMLLNSAVFLLLVTRLTNPSDLAFTHRILVGVACLVLGFAIFQHFSVAYFPNTVYQILYASSHNNPVLYSYPMLDPRTTSFFLEPSYFAGYAVAMWVVGMNAYLYSDTKWWLALCIVAFYAALTSDSSLGLLLLPLGLILTVAVLAMRRRGAERPEVKQKALSRFRVCLLALVVVFILFLQEPTVASLLTPAPPSGVATQPSTTSPVPTQAAPGAAAQSQPLGWIAAWTPGSRAWPDRLRSAKYRLWADEFSLVTVPRESLFLGAGLGSNRPSSFIAYVTSNMGLPGLIAFAAFIFFISRSFLRNVGKLSPMALAVGLGFFVYMLGMLSGLPDPSWPPFLWIFAGITIAGMADASGGSRR